MFTEIVSYRCAADLAASDHIDAARRAHHAVIAGHPGFLGRMLGKVADDPADTWVDIVQWRDEADLDAAMHVVGADRTCQAWLSQIATSSVTTRRLRGVGAFGAADGAWGDESVRCWVVTSWKTHPDVDPETHRVGDEQLHREVISALPDYRGMALYRTVDASSWTELMGWSSREAAGDAIAQVMASRAPVVLEHFREADPSTVSMLFVEPKLHMRAS